SYWVNASISPTYDTETGNITGYMAIRENITDRKRAETLSITDEMTQLYNRRYFNEQFDQLWRLVARSHELLTLIMFDVDHFKNYNDDLGHHQGDCALIAVAQAIKSASRRATDYAFRLGGEEMAVLAIVQNPEEGVLLAEHIQQEINQLCMPHPSNSAAPYVTVSIGLCFFDGRDCQRASDPNLNGLYQLADKALYQAKEAGRNRIIACLEGLSCVSTSGQHRL
ncbi:MAG TPA: sensor domain-containing diguanylate cyclase, partial [Thiotrichales bacterium]|nr:sensor domain-containing diguanylate cyclase [Thiotrichales bacterium]